MYIPVYSHALIIPLLIFNRKKNSYINKIVIILTNNDVFV